MSVQITVQILQKEGELLTLSGKNLDELLAKVKATCKFTGTCYEFLSMDSNYDGITIVMKEIGPTHH